MSFSAAVTIAIIAVIATPFLALAVVGLESYFLGVVVNRYQSKQMSAASCNDDIVAQQLPGGSLS